MSPATAKSVARPREDKPPALSLAATTKPASREVRLTHRLSHMSRGFRVVLTGLAFLMFFSATLFLGLFALPLLLLFRSRLGDRTEFTRKLNSTTKLFSGFMRDAGLISYWPVVLPEGYENRGALVIANHPSLIDVVLTLSSVPELSCVAKAGWVESWLMGPLIRRTEFVPGAGLSTDAGLEGELAVIDRIEEKLRSGVPLLAFPEGTRSARDRLRKFGRGAIEAAIRAEVPILPLFIGLDEPMLMKNQPFYDVPPRTPRYHFEWFEPIETKGRGLDSKQLTKAIAAMYEARFQRFLAERRDAS